MAVKATAMPWVKAQWFTSTGAPASGYQLQTFAAGTTTAATTYTDATSGTPNANPVILDSAGRADIFLTPGVNYKFIFTTPGDTFPASSPITTEDNIAAVPVAAQNTQVPATFGAAVTPGNPVYLSDGSNGNNGGQWYLTDSTNVWSSVQPAEIGFSLSTAGIGGTGTVITGGQVTGLSGLVAGSVYYIGVSGALTTTAPTNARPILEADTTTSGLVGLTPLSCLTQTFTASGTWTAPINAGRNPKSIDVYAWGGGSGGGGGAGGVATGVVGQGGSGGGGAAMFHQRFNFADIVSPVTVTVGVGGNGGAGGASGSAHAGTNGNTITAPTASSFGTYLVTSTTPGAGVGGPATAASVFAGAGSGTIPASSGNGNSTGTGGGPGGGTSGAIQPTSEGGGGGSGQQQSNQAWAIYGGAAGGCSDNTGILGPLTGLSVFGGGGGGGGGGVNTGNTASAGKPGGGTGYSFAGGGGGGAAGANGSVGTVGNTLAGGAGGGGGGGQTAGTAGNGGNGGQPGGGGGGGGGANVAASGVGGNGGAGGAGEVIVVSYY